MTGRTVALFVTLIFIGVRVDGQVINEQNREISDMLKADSVGVLRKVAEPVLVDENLLNLPPLAVFLDAASNYPEVKYFQAKRDEERLQSKIVGRDWLKYLRLQANYQYGTNNGYMTQSADETIPQMNLSTMNTQNWYNVGAVLSIPLDDLFSRKKKVDVVRSRIEQINYEEQRALETRQLEILQAYNEVLKQLAILKVKSESVALYNAQMRISENDFVNGKIDIITLSLERGRRSAAMVTYQESRASLHNAVTLLEMLTGIKLIKN